MLWRDKIHKIVNCQSNPTPKGFEGKGNVPSRKCRHISLFTIYIKIYIEVTIVFLERLRQNNSELIDFSLAAWQRGELLPNTYVIDIGCIGENAVKIKETADRHGVKLYYMLKQLGRNPLVGKVLDGLGYEGAVAVDYEEALFYIKNGIRLSHVGHLVQIPRSLVDRIVEARPQIITVYSVEKAAEISRSAEKLGINQKLMLRLNQKDGYPGQRGGLELQDLEKTVEAIEKLKNVTIGGVCAFPCLMYCQEQGAIVPTKCVKDMERVRSYLEGRGNTDLQINLPSATCCASIPTIARLGGTHGEPGHGLSGTTPLHSASAQPERVAYLYLTEVSHNSEGRACCFGGGHYRRGHTENALLGDSDRVCRVLPLREDSIDYHFELDRECEVGQPVVMCMRTQIFTTRSRVAVADVKGGRLLGTFNPMGDLIG